MVRVPRTRFPDERKAASTAGRRVAGISARAAIWTSASSSRARVSAKFSATRDSLHNRPFATTLLRPRGRVALVRHLGTLLRVLPHFPAGAMTCLQNAAERCPLSLRENAAHVDEHHQLSDEQTAAGLIESFGQSLYVLPRRIRLLHLATQRDTALVDLGFQIN